MILKLKIEKNENAIDLNGRDLGASQPNNPFKDLLFLPHFSTFVTTICILNDGK